MKRLMGIGLATGGLLVVSVGVAFATGAIVTDDGAIHGCYKTPNGQLRVVAEGEACLDSEQPISWSERGPQGPPGPQGNEGPPGENVRGFRVARLTPDEVEITAIGSGPIGFDFPTGGPTSVLTMELPEGVYMVTSSVAARKDVGAGDFICWVQDGAIASLVTRAALGAEPGHARRATVASNGFFSIPAGGGALTLECWQAPNTNVSPEPTGEFPTVFYATVSATSVSRATLTRYPSGPVRELP